MPFFPHKKTFPARIGSRFAALLCLQFSGASLGLLQTLKRDRVCFDLRSLAALPRETQKYPAKFCFTMIKSGDHDIKLSSGTLLIT